LPANIQYNRRACQRREKAALNKPVALTDVCGEVANITKNPLTIVLLCWIGVTVIPKELTNLIHQLDPRIGAEFWFSHLLHVEFLKIIRNMRQATRQRRNNGQWG